MSLDGENPLPLQTGDVLAGLLALAGDEPAAWSETDLGAMWRHLILSPLTAYLGDSTGANERAILDSAAPAVPLLGNFADLVNHPSPPVKLLIVLKDFAASVCESANPALPIGLATVLYYSAIALAMLRHERRIAEIDSESLTRDLQWCIAQPWLDATTRAVLDNAVEHVRDTARPTDATGPTLVPEDNPAQPSFRHAPVPQPQAPDGGFPHIEGYRIIALVGGGGMGDVYHAVQLGTQRDVAIKIMRGSFSERAQLRFDREVQITARLDHPNIARVYDSGSYQGCHFYAMELIEGIHLDKYVESHAMDEERILALFQSICGAVAHAHLRGVIHRDLKPSNILVDAEGRPHLVDFGLAKKLIEEQTQVERDKGELTVEGEWAGTPAYMSPEQAAAEGEMDVRTDVYSLGVILYRLLTGEFPRDMSGSTLQIINRICNDEIRRPKLAKPAMDGELESLLLKALARSPEERYTSAGELSRDIENYLTGEPLTARPATTLYFLRKRLWRYRTPLSVAVGVLIALVVSAIGVTAQIVHERNKAVAADIFSRKEAIAAEQARRTAEIRLAGGFVSSGELVGSAGQWTGAKAYYQDAYDIFKRESAWTGSADLGLWNACRFSPPSLLEIAANKGGITDLATTPDGRLGVTASTDGSVQIWDLATGSPVRLLEGHRGRVWSVATSPDGKLAASGGADGRIRIWDLSLQGSTAPLQTLGPVSGWVTCVGFSTDGDSLVSVSGESEASIIAPLDDTICIWPLQGGSTSQPAATVNASGRVTRVACSSDGRILTAGAELAIWNLSDKRKIATLGEHIAGTTACFFSSDGATIATGDTQGTIRIWDTQSRQMTFSIKAHASPVTAIMLLDKGKTLASADENHSISVYDIATGRLLRSCSGLRRPAQAMAFSSDGRFGLSTAAGEALTVWDLSPPVEAITFDTGPAPCEDIAFFPDGQTALCGSRDGLKLLDLATGKILHPNGWQLGRCDSWALSSDAGHLATLTGKSLQIGEFASSNSARIAIIRHGRQSVPMAFSPDGRFLLMAGENSTLSLRDATSGVEVRVFAGHKASISGIAFSPDGNLAISGDRDAIAIVWNVATGREQCRLVGHKDGINAVSFSPDGKMVATASGNSSLEMGQDDYSVRLWDASTGKPLQNFAGHTSRVRAVVFGPKGNLLASAGDDQKIELWDLAGQKELRSITGHTGSIRCLGFSSTGVLLSGGDDCTPRSWDFTATDVRRECVPRVEAAMLSLRHNPTDADAMKVLGDWYAFHRIWDQAGDLLAKARSAGAQVDSLTLARCYWMTGQSDRALAEFHRAVDSHQPLSGYANLCIQTINAERGVTTQSTTAPAIGVPSRPE